MSGTNFDRVADIYDATRGLPDDVAEHVADSIVEVTEAGPDTRFLELGVGTGRIALPLVKRGFPYTGVDISEKMMARFREKAGNPPNMTLIQGDITQLPLPDNSQDVIIVIHVFHLVPEWEAALAEARRVLRPGGYFLWGGNDMPPEHPGGRIRRKWNQVVRELGGTLKPRYGDWEHMQVAITESGGRTASYRVARWQTKTIPAEEIESLGARTFSASWTVQDDVLEEANRRVLAWSTEEFGDPAVPLDSVSEFTIFVSRWDADSA